MQLGKSPQPFKILASTSEAPLVLAHARPPPLVVGVTALLVRLPARPASPRPSRLTAGTTLEYRLTAAVGLTAAVRARPITAQGRQPVDALVAAEILQIRRILGLCVAKPL